VVIPSHEMVDDGVGVEQDGDCCRCSSAFHSLNEEFLDSVRKE